MGRQYQRRGTVGENQQTGRDRRALRGIVSRNQRTAAEVRAELHIHLKDPVSTRTA
jgi:hypothetical protein